VSLVVVRLAQRPAKGAMTYGLGRTEILLVSYTFAGLWVLGESISGGWRFTANKSRGFLPPSSARAQNPARCRTQRPMSLRQFRSERKRDSSRRFERIGTMNPEVLPVRNATYGMFVKLGRAPTAEEVAPEVDLSAGEVESAWRELHSMHALVLNPASTEIRMANPFSAVPTSYRVRAANRWWYGNCAWDALGICAALHTDGRIETSCPDCAEQIAIEVRDEHVDDGSLLFHCLVPASAWWDDIIFT
jgi:hypothetical protein